MTPASIPWEKLNQDYLIREFTSLRKRLGAETSPGSREESEARKGKQKEAITPAAAIDTLAAIFELTPFEREVLLLLAGVEMDAALAAQCSEMSGTGQRTRVTFALAMSVLKDPHWSALAPSSPLRRFRLIEVEPGYGLTSAPLNIDERILHYLAGVNMLDRRLESILRRKPKPEWIAEEHLLLATETIRGLDTDSLRPTVLHLCGDDPSAQENIAALIAHRAGRELMVMRIEDTPAAGPEMDQFLHLWMRESLLLPAFLLLQWEADTPTAPARQLVERLPGPLMIASRESLLLHRVMERYEVNKPGPAGQQFLWRQALGDSAEDLAEMIGEVSEQYRFSAETIVSIADVVNRTALAESDLEPERLAALLWSACRVQTWPRL